MTEKAEKREGYGDPVAVVIHGGAGRALQSGEREAAIREALGEILAELYGRVLAGEGALEVARRGCVLLEDCEHFNAGRGSALQGDGQVRMSASLMDGARGNFSGVINVEAVQNPIEMAAYLQGQKDRVLAGQGAERLARELGLPVFNPVVRRRLEEWLRRSGEDQAAVSAEEESDRRSGTVGVVALDQRGHLAAGTSTGGRGFERVGRVSDSATVAGNYATELAAVSCTGIGEDIQDEALAVRIALGGEVISLEESMARAMEKARAKERRLAAIALSSKGSIVLGKTTEVLLAVGKNAQGQTWAF